MSKFKWIDKISGEIEGGWDKARSDLVPDASLGAVPFYDSVSSGELIPQQPFENMEDFEKWITDNWPTEVTERCAFHVHFSLKNINLYSQCIDEKFYQNFVGAMNQLVKDKSIINPQFIKRLRGENKYCKNRFDPDSQLHVIGKGEHRYTLLNYSWAYHKTIECRLFPTFEWPQTAVTAVKALVNCVEGYFDKNPPIDPVIKTEIVDDEPELPPEQVFNIDNHVHQEFKLKPFNLFVTDGTVKPVAAMRRNFRKKAKVSSAFDLEELF